jgi:hypothetical protein
VKRTSTGRDPRQSPFFRLVHLSPRASRSSPREAGLCLT